MRGIALGQFISGILHYADRFDSSSLIVLSLMMYVIEGSESAISFTKIIFLFFSALYLVGHRQTNNWCWPIRAEIWSECPEGIHRDSPL